MPSAAKALTKAAVSAIERFSKEKLLNCLVYTFANAGEVTNANEADMRHVLDLAKKYDARWVVFHGMIPYSSDKASLKADLTPAQYEWVCNKLYDLTPEYNGKPAINVYIPFYARVAKQRGMPDFDNWYNNFFLGRCFFGKFMSIAENGDAIPCSYNDTYRVGNIKNKPIKQIWEEMQNSEFFNKVKDKANIKGKCGVCEYKDLCGGCRSAALFYTGDILGSDPRCGYIPKALFRNKHALIATCSLGAAVVRGLLEKESNSTEVILPPTALLPTEDCERCTRSPKYATLPVQAKSLQAIAILLLPIHLQHHRWHCLAVLFLTRSFEPHDWQVIALWLVRTNNFLF